MTMEFFFLSLVLSVPHTKNTLEKRSYWKKIMKENNIPKEDSFKGKSL